MRIINLDAIGIKLISSKKKQVYLTKDEIAVLLSGQYEIKDKVLHINGKQLLLSDTDIENFDNFIEYVSANFG